MSRIDAPAALVDRVDEMSLLLGCVDRAVHTRQGSAIVLRGEAGVGKSSLLTAFSGRAMEAFAEAGLLSGYGQAMLNSLASDSFQPVRECLRSLATSAQRSGSRSVLERVVSSFRTHAPDWVESVPVVGQLLAAGMRTGQSFVESGRDAVEMDSRLDQLVRLVEDLVSEQPLLMVLDDLHWADTATVDLLTTLALRVEGPLVLVLAYRPDQLQSSEQTHPLQRAVFRLCRYRPDTTLLDLPRLSGGDTEVLVRQAAAGRAIPAHVVSRIVRLSAGNPLFAESLVRVGDHGDDSAPVQITAVLEERLSYLSGEDQRLLETAALVGFSFEVDYLAQLARQDVDHVYERLDVLYSQHGLVRPAEPRGDYDRYVIHHPLFAQILRERGTANPPRWRRQHVRFLEILESEPDWDDEMAVRAAATAVAARNQGRAGELALAAARRQFAMGAVSKARDLARIAVEQTPSFQAHALLAECLSAEGDHVGGSDACTAALACTATETVAPALEAHVRLLWARNLRMTCRWTETVRVLDDLTAAHPDPGPLLAETLMLQAEVALCGPVQNTEACIALCDRVVAMTDDPEVRSRALGHRGLAHLAAYQPPDTERWLSQAVEAARSTGHPYAEYEALHWLSKKTMACVELDRSWRLLEELARMSQNSGVASENPPHLRDSSRVLGLQRRYREAAESFARYIDASLPTALGRVAVTLACQVRELEDLYGRAAGERLLAEMRGMCREDLLAADRCTRLADHLSAFVSRPPDWNAVAFSISALGVTAEDAQAADAIFRFDVPSLAHLRGIVRGSGVGA
ncbi:MULTISPECIES: AAA family ATPase [unclassified Nocardia]|uniref:ATP-binding protein n=1 Tax=unclassified Nocardia TaxID=2637762 RepID=UPI00278C48B2|nr:MULTISPECIES: AAA family ATPase [unclassified Nocardia]